MARPRKPDPFTAKPSLRLYPGEDDDLIAYLEQAQADGVSLATAVVSAMRGGITAVAADGNMDEAEAAEELFSLMM